LEEELLERFYRVGIFLIREIWTPLENRQGSDLGDPRSKNGKIDIEIGIERERSLFFVAILAKASSFNLTEARTRAVQAYLQTPHGKNGLQSYRQKLNQYIIDESAKPIRK
jgi:hypothetical protein